MKHEGHLMVRMYSIEQKMQHPTNLLHGSGIIQWTRDRPKSWAFQNIGTDAIRVYRVVGNHRMNVDLFNLHYTEQLSVDFSEIVIKQMQDKHPNLEWRVEDVRRLGLEDSSFDGTLDAMLYGSQWNPPDEVQGNVQQYVDEVSRILKPKGSWLYITFRQPHFVKPQLLREGVWDLVVERLEDDPGTFEYFVYAMTKSAVRTEEI
ncbi:MAG: hypothetical protein Q9167_002801 [Letrouitia subvulpina]